MKTASSGAVAEGVRSTSVRRSDRRVQLPPVGVPRDRDRQEAEPARRPGSSTASARRIAPAHVPSTGVAAPRDLADRLFDPRPLHELPERRRLAAGDHEARPRRGPPPPCGRAARRRPPARARRGALRSRPAGRGRRSRDLPAARLELLGLGELRGLDPLHALAETLGRLRDAVRVLEVRRRLDDGARPRSPGRRT